MFPLSHRLELPTHQLALVQAVSVQAVSVQAVSVQAVSVQAEFPAQLHDRTILDALYPREIYVVDPKTAWRLAAALLAPAA